MAKLSAHGAELLRADYPTHRLAYMADGKVLKNDGNGWKLWRKVKDGVDPVEHAETCRQNKARRDTACPCQAEYVALLCREVTLETRWKLHLAIQSMPGDADGVWSDAGEEMGLDIDTCVLLCRLYTIGQAELKAWNAAKQTPEAVPA